MSRRRREIAPPEGLQITQLRRDHRAIWRARVHLNGAHLDVDREFGSWQATVGERRTFVPNAIAAALQAKVKTAEVAERRAAEREAVPA